MAQAPTTPPAPAHTSEIDRAVVACAAMPFESALARAARIQRGEVTAVATVEESLATIRAQDELLHAFVHVDEPKALKAARKLDDDRAQGRAGTGLWGLPMGVKDIFQLAWMPMRSGSRAYGDFVPWCDDVVVEHLRRAGFAFVGKTATSELAILPYVHPSFMGPTRNPTDTRRYAGGSSGGAAAAVASGMLPVAMGSDAAGSIRIPAAYCGLVGFKPSKGAQVSSFAHMDEFGIASVGGLGRDVLDVAALCDTLRPSHTDAPWLQQAQAAVPPLRIGVSVESTVTPTDPLVQDAVRAAAAKLTQLGHQVRSPAPFVPGQIDEFVPLLSRMTARAPVLFPSRLEDLTTWFRKLGAAVSHADAAATSQRLRARVDTWFGDADAWLTPTVPGLAPMTGTFSPLPVPERFARAATLGAYTAPFNVAGLPAVTVPAGKTADGDPLAVQLVMRAGQDGTALALARQLHHAFGP